MVISEFGNNISDNSIIMFLMQQTYYKKLQQTIGQLVRDERMKRKLKFTIFCYENDIPKTSLYMLEKGHSNSRLGTFLKVVKSMNMSFEEFGKMLDKALAEADNE